MLTLLEVSLSLDMGLPSSLDVTLLSSLDAASELSSSVGLLSLDVVSELSSLDGLSSSLDVSPELSLSSGVDVGGLGLLPGFPPLVLPPLGFDGVFFSL